MPERTTLTRYAVVDTNVDAPIKYMHMYATLEEASKALRVKNKQYPSKNYSLRQVTEVEPIHDMEYTVEVVVTYHCTTVAGSPEEASEYAYNRALEEAPNRTYRTFWDVGSAVVTNISEIDDD